jgi:hypothetical protein
MTEPTVCCTCEKEITGIQTRFIPPCGHVIHWGCRILLRSLAMAPCKVCNKDMKTGEQMAHAFCQHCFTGELYPPADMRLAVLDKNICMVVCKECAADLKEKTLTM